MMISAVIGFGVLVVPLVVPSYRELHGMPSFQYDGGASHPVRPPCSFHEAVSGAV
jgi:hypothetical protein